ncbi:hypothetical protein EXIGLDRAFT_280264 [Exidia glandulosa HHB12029]|uniref:Uncharacterized protein n=1 Tax=Exidia glandulosa HHB12029 TaxID=1314781 RepID=A0A165ZPE6_EXIGL|nr:hypothetical protein EXIGLDRAFT_280264 [Exidia glandulosa HHB12029]
MRLISGTHWTHMHTARSCFISYVFSRTFLQFHRLEVVLGLHRLQRASRTGAISCYSPPILWRDQSSSFDTDCDIKESSGRLRAVLRAAVVERTDDVHRRLPGHQHPLLRRHANIPRSAAARRYTIYSPRRSRFLSNLASPGVASRASRVCARRRRHASWRSFVAADAYATRALRYLSSHHRRSPRAYW